MNGGQRFATTQWIINQRAARTLRVEQQALNHQGRSVLVGTTIKQLTVRHGQEFYWNIFFRIEEYISEITLIGMTWKMYGHWPKPVFKYGSKKVLFVENNSELRYVLIDKDIQRYQMATNIHNNRDEIVDKVLNDWSKGIVYVRIAHFVQHVKKTICRKH